MDDFEKELKTGFLEEATQLLQEVEQCFLTLESQSNDPQIIEQIFRLAHNLKGSSKAVGFEDLGTFTHKFESLLLKIKKNELPKSTKMISLLLRCNDHIREWVDELKTDLSATKNSAQLLSEMDLAMSGGYSEGSFETEEKKRLQMR